MIEVFIGCYEVQRKGIRRTGERKRYCQGRLSGHNDTGCILKNRLQSIRWDEGKVRLLTQEKQNLPKHRVMTEHRMFEGLGMEIA